jgi:hypothetical protein
MICTLFRAKSGGMIIVSRAKSGGMIIVSRPKSGSMIIISGAKSGGKYDISKCWHRLKTPLDYLTTDTSLSPTRRGFAPGFVNCKKW